MHKISIPFSSYSAIDLTPILPDAGMTVSMTGLYFRDAAAEHEHWLLAKSPFIHNDGASVILGFQRVIAPYPVMQPWLHKLTQPVRESITLQLMRSPRHCRRVCDIGGIILQRVVFCVNTGAVSIADGVQLAGVVGDVQEYLR